MTDRITTGPTGWAEVPDPPTISTPNLVLRPVLVDDADTLAPIRNQPSVMKGLNRATLVTVESLRATLQTAIGQADMGLAYTCTITIGGRVIGVVEFESVNPFEKTAALTVWIDENMHGKGYGTEACDGIIRWGFQGLGLERIDGIVRADNTASQAMIRGLGFVCHGPAEGTNSFAEKTEVAFYILTKAAWIARETARA